MEHEGWKRPRLGTIIFVAAGALVVAATLFRVPLATVFTLGLLLLCPLLMAGMHGGGHGDAHTDSPHDVQTHTDGRADGR